MDTPTALETLFTNVATVISNIINYLGNVCSTLLGNPIFQIMVGIAILYIIIGIVFRLVRKMRKGGR